MPKIENPKSYSCALKWQMSNEIKKKPNSTLEIVEIMERLHPSSIDDIPSPILPFTPFVIQMINKKSHLYCLVYFVFSSFCFHTEQLLYRIILYSFHSKHVLFIYIFNSTKIDGLNI